MPPQPARSISVPIAVFIAFAVIAGAWYFSRPSAPGTDNASAPVKLKKNIPPLSPDDYLLGDPKAPVKIVEYVDFESPFSKTFDATMARIAGEYAGKVAWVVREFPLETLHPNAPRLALAAECAGSLGGNDAYWKFKDALFAVVTDSGFDMTKLAPTAQSAGLDAKSFDACIAAGTFIKKVAGEFNDAAAAGATGSPFSVLITPDDAQIPIVGAQSYENVKAAVDAAL